ncbi:TfoX/Sxy family protein [Hyphobacterium sp.]|uniref:TfoX/Sxy family protein n=1 Tax=Hyphobacterium sp. TaxID=2004662 RepID=UPI003BAD948D
MAYDPDLADRMEAQLVALGAAPVRKAMFGGIAFMVSGNMSYGTSREEMHVRVGPDGYEDALAQPGARPMDLTGRVMKGWITVDSPADLDDAALARWAQRTLSFVRTLPPKNS